jgi:hypothetical protein
MFLLVSSGLQLELSSTRMFDNIIIKMNSVDMHYMVRLLCRFILCMMDMKNSDTQKNFDRPKIIDCAPAL